MSTQAMHAGDLSLSIGDSNVTLGVFGPAQTSVNATLAGLPQVHVGSASGGVAGATGGVGSVGALAGSIDFVTSGHPGTGIDFLVANFSTLVAAVAPDDIWLFDVINSTQGGSAQLSLATFTADWNTFAGLVAALPKVPRVWVVGCFANTELWSAGPAWAGPADPPTSPSIDDYNNALKSVCTANGWMYVDARAAALPLEPTGNPGKAQGGYLVNNASPFIHLSAAGQSLVGTTLVATVQVVP